jgi:hypothetical protein
MKRKYKFLSVILVFIFLGLMGREQYLKPGIPFYKTNKSLQTDNIDLSPDSILSGVNIVSTGLCDQYKNQYGSLLKLKKLNKELTLNFENKHLVYDNHVYRLRHFFKDGENGSQEIYLVYLEDEEGDDDHEHAQIIEKNFRTPGALYTKLLGENNSIIFHEIAYEVPVDKIFLHYINGKLVGIQSEETECAY